MESVLVLGGGISGLSAAMELAPYFRVTVLERRRIVGGKSRTWTDPELNVFREHSFRVFHRTYHNLFDAMSRVPSGSGSVRQNLEDYVDRGRLMQSYPETWREYRERGDELGFRERLRLARDAAALLRVMCASDPRLKSAYSEQDFADLFLERHNGQRGLLFETLRGMSQVEYSADRLNPDAKVMVNFIEKHFLHGAPGTGWFALKGPTSASFIDPWREHLAAAGVSFNTECLVSAIDFDQQSGQVAQVRVETEAGEHAMKADYYVSALTSDVLLGLAGDGLRSAVPGIPVLEKFRRVANNGALVYTRRRQQLLGGFHLWHPWRVAVTAYANRWSARFNKLHQMGPPEIRGSIRDVISYVITDWEEPGVHIRKPASKCSPEEVYQELCTMGMSDRTVVTNFDPADHVRFALPNGGSQAIIMDEALIYDPTGLFVVRNEDSLVHLPAGGTWLQPQAETPVSNFVMAGCHCYNDFGCGDSMEGANETGRRAANAVFRLAGSRPRVPIFTGRVQSRGVRALDWARAADRALHRLGW